MSNVYFLEPQTEGKLLFSTTFGDLDIELWPQQAPLACRNFVQLCLEGYYNGVCIHRIVKSQYAETGDPDGTGETWESIYDDLFKDEIHSRLRLSRRGLLMCIPLAPNKNGSQFAFTLGPISKLKCTIFGKVCSSSLYNLESLNNLLTDADGIPLDIRANRILNTKVLINPFPDIVPRNAKLTVEPPISSSPKKKSANRAIKDFNLLSFGDDAESTETENETLKSSLKLKSVPDDIIDESSQCSQLSDEDQQDFNGNKQWSEEDNKLKKVNSSPNLNTFTEEENYKKSETQDKNSVKKNDENTVEMNSLPSDIKKQKHKSRKEKKEKYLDESTSSHHKHKQKDKKRRRSSSSEKNTLSTKKKTEEKSRSSRSDNKQLQNKKESSVEHDDYDQCIEYCRNYRKNPELVVDKEDKTKNLPEPSKMDELPPNANDWDLLKPKRSSKNVTGAGREDATLNMLEYFKEKITSKVDNKRQKEKSSNGTDRVREQFNISLSHQLSFEEERAVLAKDANTKANDWFDIFDPRNQVNRRRRGEEV